MERDIERKEIIHKKLQVRFYFFVIKTDAITSEFFKSEYYNDKITVHCFVSGDQAYEFYQLCIGNGIRRGVDFVDGLNGEPFGFDYYENDWLKFEEIEGRYWVSTIKSKIDDL